VVGIVIVSHSKQLALGVRELAVQMVRRKVALAVAAGIDDPENPLGTDVMEVHSAISSVYSDSGVLVLMDLGSALMSAEMALEFLPEEQRANIYLCEAPLVEGTLAAAVAVASGKNIQEVIKEARGALASKAMQLGLEDGSIPLPLDDEEDDDPQESLSTDEQTKEIQVTVRNHLGLHARPAAQFVATAGRFQSQIKVQNLTRHSPPVRGDSINLVTTLGVRQGHELLISATGIDAVEALAALQSLVNDNFGEDDNRPQWQLIPKKKATLPRSQGELQGISASPGVSIAPAFLYRSPTLKLQQYNVENVEQEWQRLQIAIIHAEEELEALRLRTASKIGNDEAAIFHAHLLYLRDPALLEALEERIFQEHLNAEAAWQSVVGQIANAYRSLEDTYLQARVADVVDVEQRVLRLLVGTMVTSLELPYPAILVATDLTPSDTAGFDPNKVLGICTTSGSSTSHSAIIARTLGIPAVVGLGAEMLNLADGVLLALDGETGKVWVEPEPAVLNALQAKRDAWQVTQQQALTTAHKPAVTSDGRRIIVVANIGGIADAQVAVDLGAEGVGLLRTEFLYLDRKSAPSEEEQFVFYQNIADVLGSRPLIIRTLDVGGDKPLPYLGLRTETNPFLGWRGIRFSLDYPDLFKTQLRAILRASFGHKIKIMFPMISTLQEVQAAKAILALVKNELRQAGVIFDETMQVGIMIEVPSSVAIAEQLAAEVDFFSIGTNDLSQYVMACDRTNPRVASLADGFHPAVLRMVQEAVEAAHQGGIWVGLCGELAADPLAVPILLGLGLDEISLNPQAIPTLKQAISQLSVKQAQAIVRVALRQDSAVKVREVVASLINRL
jgi:multiphosphoryl transfer protein